MTALLATCYARPQGFIADTPEVTAEKMRFYQLYNDAARAAAAAPDIHIYDSRSQLIGQPQQQQQFAISFPHAVPRTTVVKPIVPTPVTNVIGGVVRNTPEVEAAIARFNQAYQAALVATGAAPGPRVPQQFIQTNPAIFVSQVPAQRTAVVTQQRWTGPFAAQVPAGLPGSTAQVAETADVSAAKATFAQAYNNQLRSVLVQG